MLHEEDATAEIARQPTTIDQLSIDAADELIKRRPPLNFEEMGIPNGAVLQSKHGATTVIVVGPRKVRLGEEEMSLTAATRLVLNIDHSVQPSPHWTYNGRLLRDLYEETYGDME